MSKILVTYATMSGSTAGAALAIGEELLHLGKEVDILPLEKVIDPAEYGAMIIGAPMVMGWHRSALKFLRQHRAALQRIPLAIFVTALSLTSTGEKEVNDVSLCVDGNLAKAPQNSHRPNLKERYSNIRRYAAPILKAAQPARPVSLAFFGGSLDYRRLKIPALLFVMVVIRTQAGDRRNWQAIRSWAQSLPALFSPIQ
jgi:menaquinone-dependent protoporphyrinogen IX oxidase